MNPSRPVPNGASAVAWFAAVEPNNARSAAFSTPGNSRRSLQPQPHAAKPKSLRPAGSESQAQNQTTGSYSQRNPSSRGGIRSALIQFAAVCFETRCKRCGRSARIFCTYLQRAGGNRELMRTESRRRDLPAAGPNPPSRLQYSAQPPSISS